MIAIRMYDPLHDRVDTPREKAATAYSEIREPPLAFTHLHELAKV
jgi:hypothetical protein